MSKYNKSYRVRTDIGKDKKIYVNLDRDYDVLEIMSLKINQKNAYKLHTSNYGVIAGRVLANEAFGIPNAKISVFIPIDNKDANDAVKSALYPYNSITSQDKNNVRYNLLTSEYLSDCHTIIGTLPGKQYVLDNDSVLEVFEKYYKYTTRTNNAGDYMIFGVPVGHQTIHVDIDLSDIGVLSQKPRDMVYKGYNIEAFENPNKFKYDTNLDSLVQVITQNNVADVIPFWGNEEEQTIGITRCDIQIQYKFEPTCVFMGSVVSDTSSNGISKKCIPTPGMGSMEEVVTGSGTIEMIRKTPSGDVEEFQIKGNQLINGDGVWCYQIPMNLDYMMTDEFGNMVPTNHPEKGIPTRTRVRFRISMQDFENDNVNLARGKMLVPHNPSVYEGTQKAYDELDYTFGTNTKESSYRDLYWNGVYSVKSYIPRIQKGTNWRNEKFTGFKRVNYYGDKNPIPYNNIRIRIPFMYTIICTLIKTMIRIAGFLNSVLRICSSMFSSVVTEEDDNNNSSIQSASFISISGELCNDNLDYLCVIPGIDINKIAKSKRQKRKTLLGAAILKHYESLGKSIDFLSEPWGLDSSPYKDTKSIDVENTSPHNLPDVEIKDEDDNEITGLETTEAKKETITIKIKLQGITVTNSIDYLIQCIEMKLAEEFKVIQFDFYNDWLNGVIYIPRWMRIITKKRKYFKGSVVKGGKIKACNENYSRNSINLVQQCSLTYSNSMNVQNDVGCATNTLLTCHKNTKVRKKFNIFKTGGLVQTYENMNGQYIYYFKPIDNNGSQGSKTARLFATDIILLGSLSECDIWGIPEGLSNLVSSTYQMPPNLALTDSDLEGNEYETKTNGDPINMTIQYTTKKDNQSLKVADLTLNEGGITTFNDGNYTELSGIDWGYEGPLQEFTFYKSNGKYPSNYKLYKPGGHFLGITCRNAETTIKSCVNLSRICEYGVWMSQRQELNIQNKDENTKEDFLNYATIPSGFISKDEISDTNYRRIFATLNNNRLRTKINPETQYPIYDFRYVAPTNFGGDLSQKIQNTNSSTNSSSNAYNRKHTDVKKEQWYDFKDDEYYDHGTPNYENVGSETEIMRTGEFKDNEYLKYRFGYQDSDFKTSGNIESSSFSKRFLATNSFPLYENSFYFYFGLHDGRTALDEFKKTYYANCKKTTLFDKANNEIKLLGLTINDTGFNSGYPSGSISWSGIDATSEQFENGVNISLKEKEGSGKTFDKSVNYEFDSLAAGDYTIIIECGNYYKTITTTVGSASASGKITGTPFYTYVDKNSGTIFTLDKREKIGGYITFKNNSISYIINGTTEDINLFEDDRIAAYYLETDNMKNAIIGKSTTITYTVNNGSQVVNLQKNSDGLYMIPVPQVDVKYYIRVEAYINSEGKLTNSSNMLYSSQILKTNYTDIIYNGSKLDVSYNNISVNNEILSLSDNFSDLCNGDSVNGWWDYPANEKPLWYTDSDETMRWKIKETIYMSNNNKNISIIPYRGRGPYSITIQGQTEDFKKFEDGNTSALNGITIPTINYYRVSKNGETKELEKRQNFSLSVTDSSNQYFPAHVNGGKNQKFIIPVIYKPFFVEYLLCYYSDKPVYLCGNIYNGFMWSEEKEGFNNIYFNGQKINDIKTTLPDTTFILDEVNDNGKLSASTGLKYKGEYFKYNGRKITHTYKINNNDLSRFILNNDGEAMVGELNIGSLHVDNGVTYKDETSIKQEGLSLHDFTLEPILSSDNEYRFIMDVVNPDNKHYYDLYALIDDNSGNDGHYPYPFEKGSPTIVNTKLFRNIMSGNIKSVFNTSEAFSIYDEKLNNKNLYYIAIPNDGKNKVVTTKSNNNSILKAVSISKLIDIAKLKGFYPLELTYDETRTHDIYDNGVFTTTVTLIGQDDKSKKNIEGKNFKVKIYNDEKGTNLLHEVTLSANNNEVRWNLTAYDREKLGITNNVNTPTGVYYTCYYRYTSVIRETEESSPSSYKLRPLHIVFINKNTAS